MDGESSDMNGMFWTRRDLSQDELTTPAVVKKPDAPTGPAPSISTAATQVASGHAPLEAH